jgi:SAM-dependent methyltransferase
VISWYHQHFIHKRRVGRLADHLAALIVENASVLDVGAGDGKLAASISARRPDVAVHGIDVLVRDDTAIQVGAFDGKTFPGESKSVDTVIMIDVLHHTERPGDLLLEAARLARRQVILKDHYLRGVAARQTLAFMDRIGNARHGVEIPGNYLRPEEWEGLYLDAGLERVLELQKLDIYPLPLSLIFERGLHFIALLEPLDR